MNPDNHIKLRHLNCFLEVARQGSVQRAAEILSISQPAVSKTLKELESLLECQLFERGHRGVTLTDAGTVFLHAAGPSLQALRRGVQSLRSGEYQAGELRLGVLSSVEGRLMPEVIRRLHHSHHGLRISAEGGPASYLLGLLRSAELDLVIGRLSDSPHVAGLQFEPLYSDAMVTVVRSGHPLLDARRDAVVSRLNDYPVVLPPPDTTLRQHADSLLLQAGAGLPDTRLETLSNALARSYVLQADAVWLAPQDAVTEDLAESMLGCLVLPGQASGGAVGVCSNPAIALSLAGQWCVDILREVAADRI